MPQPTPYFKDSSRFREMTSKTSKPNTNLYSMETRARFSFTDRMCMELKKTNVEPQIEAIKSAIGRLKALKSIKMEYNTEDGMYAFWNARRKEALDAVNNLDFQPLLDVRKPIRNVFCVLPKHILRNKVDVTNPVFNLNNRKMIAQQRESFRMSMSSESKAFYGATFDESNRDIIDECLLQIYRMINTWTDGDGSLLNYSDILKLKQEWVFSIKELRFHDIIQKRSNIHPTEVDTEETGVHVKMVITIDGKYANDSVVKEAQQQITTESETSAEEKMRRIIDPIAARERELARRKQQEKYDEERKNLLIEEFEHVFKQYCATIDDAIGKLTSLEKMFNVNFNLFENDLNVIYAQKFNQTEFNHSAQKPENTIKIVHDKIKSLKENRVMQLNGILIAPFFLYCLLLSKESSPLPGEISKTPKWCFSQLEIAYQLQTPEMNLWKELYEETMDYMNPSQTTPKTPKHESYKSVYSL